MGTGALGRLLAMAGASLLVLGLLLILLGRLPLVGHLPGDIILRRNGLTVFLPLATMLLVSVVLTVVVNLVLRLFRSS